MSVTPSRGSSSPARPQAAVLLLLLLAYVALLAAYVGLRYRWHIVESDSFNLTRASLGVFAEATRTPAGAYSYGYAYPTLNAFLAHITGVPVESLQSFVQPFLLALLVPVSYVTYRSLTGRSRTALLASVMLFLSPEFLFEGTRSSHAKITWLLALTMLCFLSHSFLAGRSPRRLAVWVALFYLATFGLIASSSFFASSYVFGITFSFAATLVLLRLPHTRSGVAPQLRRLASVSAACLVLVFVFIFYLYPPGSSSFNALQSTLDKLAVFLFSAEIAAARANPYAYVEATWLSTPIYLALSAFNWFVLSVSFAVWVRKGVALLRREALAQHDLLLWLLYGSFGLLMVLSVTIDLSGALSSNLQVRIFPHFLLFGIPLAAEGMIGFLAWARRNRSPLLRKTAPALVVALLAAFSLGSLLKITNEPLLSNWWTFYADDELSAVDWIAAHVRNNNVWSGEDERLTNLVEVRASWRAQGLATDRSSPPVSSRYVLQTDITAARASRLGDALPDTRGSHKVYDAGGAALYYSRPVTPYQR